MEIKESGEMYLETILLLSEAGKEVHAVEIADALNFSKASVSRAIGKLRDEDFIAVGADDAIKLTAKGKKLAKKVYEKRVVLTEFLIGLGVKKNIAEADACKMEHVISDATLNALKKCK